MSRTGGPASSSATSSSRWRRSGNARAGSPWSAWASSRGCLHKLGLDSTDPVRVGGTSVSPRDVVAACLPDPAGLGDKMSGLTCAGTWVT